MVELVSSELNVTMKSRPGDPPTVNHYRIRDVGDETIVDNRAWFYGKFIESRSVFCRREGRILRSWVRLRGGASIDTAEVACLPKDIPDPKDVLEFGAAFGDDASLSLCISKSGRRWSEFYREIDPECVPFNPFSYGEITWLMRNRFDFDSNESQTFPYFRINDANAFEFQGFLFVMQKKEVRSGSVVIGVCHVFLGAMGKQLEPYEIGVDAETRTVVRMTSTLRKIEMVADKSISEETSDRWSDFNDVQGPFPLESRSFPKQVIAVDSPLSLTVDMNMPEAGCAFVLFDLLRFSNEALSYTQFIRQNLPEVLRRYDCGVFEFREVWAHSALGFMKSQVGDSNLSFVEIERVFRDVWLRLEAVVPKAKIPIALEENAWLVLAGLGGMKNPPPVVLFAPSWGSLADYQKTLQPDTAIEAFLTGFGSDTLESLVREYKGPVLAFSPGPSPVRRPGLEVAEMSAEFPLVEPGHKPDVVLEGSAVKEIVAFVRRVALKEVL